MDWLKSPQSIPSMFTWTSTIGVRVGAGVGTGVGAGVVGDGVGAVVGAGVGAGVGTKVGNGTGTSVGAGIGTCVGICDGAGVGFATVGAGVIEVGAGDGGVVGGADGVPKLYRIFRNTARKIGDDANLLFEFPPLEGRIFAVDISKDAKRIAAGSSLDGKGAIHIYEVDPNAKIPDNVAAAIKQPTHQRNAEMKKALPDVNAGPTYVKDDFFDTMSCEALEKQQEMQQQGGRARFAQMRRHDMETFGAAGGARRTDHGLNQGGRGGRGGPGGRGAGRGDFRGGRGDSRGQGGRGGRGGRR